ncbi:MAG: ORF6N domain-containing protein [Spirochaetaceae bacterium]|nr:ORF6N domain-containing protein [Spirochaetaceae bacterium]
MNELQSIKSMIYEIRGYQVMLDMDLSKIYQVETRVLNQAVKRNIERFPPEFMFQLTAKEYDFLGSQFATSNLKSQIVTSSWGGRRKLPFVFTEHGVIMLSSVLSSKVAIQINVAIVKAFIDMRRYITKPAHEKLVDLEKVLMLHIDDTSHNFVEHAAIINEIIGTLNNMIETPPEPKRKIGFKSD